MKKTILIINITIYVWMTKRSVIKWELVRLSKRNVDTHVLVRLYIRLQWPCYRA